MNTINLQLSETIKALRNVQLLLQLLLDDAAALLAEQSDAENDQWLLAIVDKLLANLREQFRIEEDAGYLTSVREQYPQWHPQVSCLQQKHECLERELKGIATQMWRERLAGAVTEECRRQLADWINLYRQHQRRETALVQEAFVLEVGEGE